MEDFFKAIVVVIGIVVLVVGLYAGLGWVFKILWNYVMMPVFHLPMLTYKQSVAIVILAQILFGGVKTTTKSS